MHRGSYYDSVFAIELKKTQDFLLSSFQRWFLSMTSLAVTSSMLKFSVKFGGTSFKFCLRPYNTGDSIKIYHLLIFRIAVHGEAPNIFCQFCVVLYVACDSLKQY